MNTRERLAFLKRQTEPDMQRRLGENFQVSLRAVIECAPENTDFSGLKRREQEEYCHLWTNYKIRLLRLLPGETVAQVEQLIEFTPKRLLRAHLRSATQAVLTCIGALCLLHFTPLNAGTPLHTAAVTLSTLFAYLSVWGMETQRYAAAARDLNARLTLVGIRWPDRSAGGRGTSVVNRRA